MRTPTDGTLTCERCDHLAVTDRRGLLGGLLLVVGAVPLVVVYGTHPFGYLGLALAVVGIVVAYGAYKVE